MRNRFIIFEPEAKALGGHYFHVSKGLQKSIQDRGMRCELIVNKKMKLNQDSSRSLFRMGYWRTDYTEAPYRIIEQIIRRKSNVNVLHFPQLFTELNPVVIKTRFFVARKNKIIIQKFRKFSVIPFRLLNRIIGKATPILKAIDFFRVLRAMDKSDPSLMDANIIIPTANSNEVYAVKLMLAFFPQLKFHIFIRQVFVEPHNSEMKTAFEIDFPKSQLGRNILAMSDAIRKGCVSFYTDTYQLKYLLEGATGIKFNVTGVPTIIPTAPKVIGSRYSITFLGDSRSEKGFDALPQIVDDGSKSFENLNFDIQVAGLKKSGMTGRVSAILLEQISKESPQTGVNLHYGDLGLDSYANLLGKANIVLLPYERENYVRRSSGIFYESLFNSAIPIIPTGTSMSCSVYQTYSTWLERHGNSQESESLVQGKSYIASFHCKMDEMTAFCFSYVGDNGSNLKIIIRDDTFGEQDSHLILNLEPQLANRFAIPINPNFGSISVEISREDGSTFILQEVSLSTHSLDASFYGIVFDSKMKIADNIKYVLMNLEKSVVAVEYIKEVLMLSNSYVNAVDVILENTK